MQDLLRDDVALDFVRPGVDRGDRRIHERCERIQRHVVEVPRADSRAVFFGSLASAVTSLAWMAIAMRPFGPIAAVHGMCAGELLLAIIT